MGEAGSAAMGAPPATGAVYMTSAEIQHRRRSASTGVGFGTIIEFHNLLIYSFLARAIVQVSVPRENVTTTPRKTTDGLLREACGGA